MGARRRGLLLLVTFLGLAPGAAAAAGPSAPPPPPSGPRLVWRNPSPPSPPTAKTTTTTAARATVPSGGRRAEVLAAKLRAHEDEMRRLDTRLAELRDKREAAWRKTSSTWPEGAVHPGRVDIARRELAAMQAQKPGRVRNLFTRGVAGEEHAEAEAQLGEAIRRAQAHLAPYFEEVAAIDVQLGKASSERAAIRDAHAATKKELAAALEPPDTPEMTKIRAALVSAREEKAAADRDSDARRAEWAAVQRHAPGTLHDVLTVGGAGNDYGVREAHAGAAARQAYDKATALYRKVERLEAELATARKLAEPAATP